MNPNQSIYSTGNLIDNNNDGALNGSSIDPGGGGTVLTAPWSPLSTNVTVYSTAGAYHYDVSLAGALPYDQLDSLIISQIKTLGNGPAGTGAGTAGPGGGLYYDQTSTGLGNNGYGVLNGGTAPLDTDQDGMPDYWEEALGSNPNVADSLTPGTGGYTRLENYLNWLAGPHAVVSKNSFGDVDLRQYTGGFTNASPIYSTFAPTNGAVTLLVDGHTARFTPTANFSGLGSFNFSVRANDGSAMTNIVGVLTTATGLPRNLIWRGDGVTNNWDSQSTNWLNGAIPVTFNSGDTVTLDGSGSNNPAINLVGVLQPAAVTVAANQNYTFGGSGSLGGVMSLAKSGTGILTIGTSNTFTGGTTVSAGTLQVNNPSGSATGTNQVLVASGATLSGNGIIGGPTAFDDGAILAPGNGSGTLTISNELDLSDLTVLQFGLGTNSGKVVVSGNLVLGGLLNITDLGGFGAGTYTLMTCGGALSGTLPVIGSKPSGYRVTVNTNTAGQVRLVVQVQTPPVFGNIVILNDAVVFGGSGGPANVPYYVLTSTNIALPVANWTRLLTNYFDPSGNFTVTNPVNPGFAQSYFLLQLP
jgi:autotransporter-associated beta strand protein